MEEKKRRVISLFKDLAIDGEEYKKERLSIDAALAALIIPEESETIEAGTYLSNLSKLWCDATLEERHDLLRSFLDAVYVDTVGSVQFFV